MTTFDFSGWQDSSNPDLVFGANPNLTGTGSDNSKRYFGMGYTGSDIKRNAMLGRQGQYGEWSYIDPVAQRMYRYNPQTDQATVTFGSRKSGGSGGGSSGSGNSTTSSSNSLFGTGGYLGTGVNFDDYVNKMKELTDWRLGIDKRSMENAYGFRNQEATRDYGFQTGLAGQQIQGQKDITGMQIEGTKNLETLRNEYMNKRQSEQLENQRTMQQAGFGQQNKLLADNAARARSLYFGTGGM